MSIYGQTVSLFGLTERILDFFCLDCLGPAQWPWGSIIHMVDAAGSPQHGPDVGLYGYVGAAENVGRVLNRGHGHFAVALENCDSPVVLLSTTAP